MQQTLLRRHKAVGKKKVAMKSTTSSEGFVFDAFFFAACGSEIVTFGVNG